MSVYFAQSGAYIKIGFSADPFARVTTVTTNGKRPIDLPRGADADLIGWIPGNLEVEACWHRQFAADHVRGEWFYIDPEIVREAIWADPRGVDITRMSALAVFVARGNPHLTREDIARAGVRVEGVPIEDVVDDFWRAS